MTDVHRDVQEIVGRTVLPEVIQVHDIAIPYPAELWVNGQREHEDGTAMFSIGDGGYLTAEYFAYDNPMARLEWLGPGLDRLDAKVIIRDTQVEIPIWHIQSSRKARTQYSHQMATAKAYECEIQGWMGDLDSQMKSARITLMGLPDIHLGSYTTHVPEESTAVENLTLRGLTRKTGSLMLEAGNWKVQLTATNTSASQEPWPLYYASLSRKDNFPFTLENDINNGIIDALYNFMSFQCQGWIRIPTIICNPVFSVIEKNLVLRDGEGDPEAIHAVRAYTRSGNWWEFDELGNVLRELPGFEDVADASLTTTSIKSEHAQLFFSKGNPLVKRAWVGKLSQQNKSDKSTWTATDFDKWPKLFRGFWEKYADKKSRKHLKNAILHYVEHSRIFDDGALHYGMVAAQAALQAVVRWWNDLDEDFQFGSGPGRRFNELLQQAVCRAELGKARGKEVDSAELSTVIRIATDYRNKIDHGQAGNLDGDMQRLVGCQIYYQNLARLLILSKFGNRDTDARGCMVGPRFKDVQT